MGPFLSPSDACECADAAERTSESRQVACALVGGGEIERRVAATGRRALGIGLLDEGVAQAGRARILDDHAMTLGAKDDVARRRQVPRRLATPGGWRQP